MNRILSIIMVFVLIFSFSVVYAQEEFSILQSLISEDFNSREFCENGAIPAYTVDKSSFYWAHNNSVSTAIVKDGEKGSNVLKISQPSTADSGATLDATALMHMDHDFSFDEGIDNWNRTVVEFSFKTNTFMRANMVLLGTQIFRINRNGTYSGIYNNVGERVIGEYRVGEWNHVKIIFDHENKFNDAASKVFIYMNSGDGYKEYISGGTNYSSSWGATYLDSNANFTSASQKKMRISVFANQDETTEFLLDDVNVYTTDSEMALIDVTSDFEGTALASETYNIEGNTIKAPAKTTLGDLKEKLLNTENQISCGAFSNAYGEAIEESEYVTTPASGNKLCIISTTGKAVSYYSIEEGELPYRMTGMSVSKINNIPQGSETAVPVDVLDVSEVSAGDELKLSVNFTNEGAAKENILVFAVYDGEKLIGAALENIQVAEGARNSAYTMQKTVSIPQNAELSSELSLRAFVWESIMIRVPSLESIIMD